MYMQNNGGEVRLAMVSTQGRAQVCNRNMELFTLEMMTVEKVILCGADWIGFLGERLQWQENK